MNQSQCEQRRKARHILVNEASRLTGLSRGQLFFLAFKEHGNFDYGDAQMAWQNWKDKERLAWCVENYLIDILAKRKKPNVKLLKARKRNG